MKTPQESNTQRAAVAHQRLVRRLERRDKRIAGLERKIQQLENALAWRTMDLESLSRNIRREVQDALCNVRMIPVFDGKRDRVIAEVRHIPTNVKEMAGEALPSSFCYPVRYPAHSCHFKFVTLPCSDLLHGSVNH